MKYLSFLTTGRTRFAAAVSAAVISSLLIISGCGGGGGKNAASPGVSPTVSAASRGKGQVAFTIHWPAATAAKSRLLPTASKSIKFTVVEYDAPNNVVVLTKIAARPPDTETTSTVLLDGLPTVLVNIKAEAFPSADATGVVQAAGLLTVSIEQNKTIDKTITLNSTVKSVEVTAAAPVTIGADGKFSLNLSDTTNPDSIKAALTATAYNAAHEIVLTALDKWVYQSEKPNVATVSPPTDGTTRKAKGRAEGIGGAQAVVTAVGAGDSVITITESESQVATQVTASVVGNYPTFWNQGFGDAQNSSCSSGPSASGSVVSSFEPLSDVGTPGKSLINIVNPVEDRNGNIAFSANDFDTRPQQQGVYVFSKSGTRQNYFSSGTGVTISPVYGLDGTLYTLHNGDTLTGSSHIVARGPHSWDFTGPGLFTSYLTLSGDGATLYVSSAGTLLAIDAATGAKRWEAALSSVGASAGAGGTFNKPAVSLDNATVYVGTDKGGAVAFDAATGSKRWASADQGTNSVGYYVYVGVGPTGTVYVQSSGAIFSFTGNLRAVDPATGNTLWTKDDFIGNFVLSRTGTVYGGTGGASQVQALNGATGAVLWTKGTHPSSVEGTRYYSFMGASDGTVYVIQNDYFSSFHSLQSIAALNGADGSTKWTLAPFVNNSVDTLDPRVTISHGSYTLLLVGEDGTVYGRNSVNPSSLPIDAIR